MRRRSAVAAAQADVTVEENMSVSGCRPHENGQHERPHHDPPISGNRARTESDLQFESGMMRTLARGAGQSTEIVQLDTTRSSS